MRLDWQGRVDEFSNVMKLVHLAMRRDFVDEEQIRTELLEQGRRAYEDELTLQAKRMGCDRVGQLLNGPILSELNETYTQHAASIANTYNYDLAAQVEVIRREVPTANRHVYAYRLRQWDEVRAAFKNEQIGQVTENYARSLAMQHFYQYNGSVGTAVLQPGSAVCPVCQGWIDRGEVPLPVAMGNPPPYHPSCPHYWETAPGQRDTDACALLWMGE